MKYNISTATHSMSIRYRAWLVACVLSLLTTPTLYADDYDGAMPESKVPPPTAAQRFAFPVTGGTLAFVPYGPNIIRVTVTPGTTDRVVPSGWGTIAAPSGENEWNVKRDSFTVSSSKIAIKIDPQSGQFVASRPDGSPICHFSGFQFSPNTVNKIATTKVEGRFAVEADEHFFGLGQHQNDTLDLRGQKLTVWHQYNSHQTIGFPFLVSSHHYAIMWDNPARTQVECAINGTTTWSSEMGDALAFFLIVGNSSDEVYSGYRALTGATPIPPKAALGLIQCKARYASQKELLDVAQGYRDRHYPCDTVVVDYFHWKTLGDLAVDPKAWPDPKAMNDKLHQLGFHSMITVWPCFSKGSTNYQEVVDKKLFFAKADGTPSFVEDFHRDAGIDSTNPQARVWYWNKVKNGYGADGFDYFWMDETEPDIEWHDSVCYLGPCAAVYNIFPLVHASSLYLGHRSVSNERIIIQVRDAYLGTQRYGTTIWSSDIGANWDSFRNQITTGLNMCASGLPYWSSDTGGWQPMPGQSHPAHLLLDPSDARDVVGQNDDYPELFVRWFEYSSFCPTFRLHGMRKANEVWSFGKAAEPILVKYLRLRYQLLPYIYSQARYAEETGAPFMRALFMDFPNDPEAITQKHEYMFGPAFLVAPILSQNTIEQTVYLPSGTDWYNYWTNQRYHGGQSITVPAAIDTLPLFVRAGSILPLGSDIETTQTPQTISEIRVYEGANGDFDLYDDDGHTYDYESGKFTLTHLQYNEATEKFSQDKPSSIIPSNVNVAILKGN